MSKKAEEKIPVTDVITEDELDALDASIDALAMSESEEDLDDSLEGGLEIEKDATTRIAHIMGMRRHADEGHAEEDFSEDDEAEEVPEKAPEEAPKAKATKKSKDAGFNTNRDVYEQRMARRMEKQQKDDEAYEQNLKWQLIQNHRMKKSILKGVLTSIEDTSSEDALLAVVEYTGFRVVIPFSEMFAKEPIANASALSHEELVKRHRQLLLKLLGAEIDFIVVAAQTLTDANTREKKKIILGSRKQALTKQRRFYFGKNKADERRINPGDMIRQVPIIAVGRESVRVVIGGVETTVHKNSLSYKFLSSVSTDFKVGMKIDLIITDIKENDPEDSSDVTLRANHKMTQLPYFKEHVKGCKPGGYYRAQITYVKGYQVYLFLTDINAPAFCRILRLWDVSDLPKPGDEVVFMANNIDEERGVVHGVITRTL